jgi:hypothetical protein
MKKILMLMLCVATVALAGCAPHAPLAPEEDDRIAKQFETRSGLGVIYIFRKKQFTNRSIALPVSLDDQLIGHISEYEYLRIDVKPGRHVVTVKGLANLKSVTLNVEVDSIEYVEFLIDGDYRIYRTVDEATGQNAIKKRDMAIKHISGVFPALP